jgi:hypothetical protein
MAKNQGAGGGNTPDPKAGKGLRDNLVSAELAARELSQDLGYALENLAKTQEILEKQAKTYTGLVGSSQLLNYLAKDNLKFAQDLTQVYETETQVSNDLLLKRNMISTQLQGEYAQLLTTYMLENDITDVNDNKVQLLVKQLKHRQEVNEKLTQERDLYEEIADSLVEVRDEAESYKKGLDKILATARAIGNDPKAMGGLLLQQGAKKLEAFTEGFKEFKEEGLSAGQAIQAQMNTINVESVLGLSDMKGAQQGVIQAYGNVNAVSKETLSNIGSMAHHFGIAGTEAAALNASLSQIPGETSESAAHAMEMTGHLAEMQGIAPGKIMKDMAKNTGEMARAGNKGAEEFGKSVVALHKMGVEMSTASKVADGLLDFESSITAQMEASALLGKEINLDKAREAALNNDMVGMTAEIAKNIGGSAEFGRMNRLQQDALAKSVGMSVEELTKQMDAQEESNKYFGEGASTAENAMGKMLEYGSGAAGFFKENGLLLLASLQFISSGNAAQMVGNGLTMAKNVLLGIGNGLLLVGKGIAFATSLIYSAERREEAIKMVKTAAFWVAQKAHIGFMIAKYAVLKAASALGIPGAAGAADKAKQAVTDKLKEKATEKLEEKGGDLADKAADKGVEKIESVAAGGADKAGDLAEKTKDVDKASKVKTGGGFKSAMKDLAGGFKEMANTNVLKGIFNTALAGPALIVALPAIPFLLFMGLTPLKLLKSNFTGLGSGLEKMGTGGVALGSLNLMLFGLAGVVGVVAIPFMAFIAFAGTFVGIGLKGLAKGMEALAKPQVALGALILMGLALSLGASILMMGIGIGIAAAGLSLMFKELANMPLEKMMLLPIALQLMGIGLLTLGVSALVAAPGVFLATLALAGFAAVLALMQPIMAMGGLQAMADGLTAISATAGGLTQVGFAVMAIGTGLGLMAMAGLMALPIIGALVGLAAVAPMLASLGGVFGGGGEEGGGEDDKMQLIADKLDQLIAVASKGGEIKMDGRKVGEVIRLGLNTSNVR